MHRYSHCISAMPFTAALGRRVCKDPEIVFTNKFLLGRALRRLAATNPACAALSSAAPVEGTEVPEGDGRQGSGAQAGDAASQDSGMGDAAPVPPAGGLVSQRWRHQIDSGEGMRFMGSGKPVRKGERELVVKALKEWQEFNPNAGWYVEDAIAATKVCSGPSSVVRFERGICNEQEVFAEGYGRSKCRANYWVHLRYEEKKSRQVQKQKVTEWVVVPYVGRVMCFILVPHATKPPLRLAMCRVYAHMEQQGRMHEADACQERWKHLAEEVDKIEGKLVCAYPSGHKQGLMYFMPYANI